MEISGYKLPLIDYPNLALSVHPHQAEMLDHWNQEDAFLVVTKTGSGKTAAVTLPIAQNLDTHGDNCAVFVYPTNALMRDQTRSITELLEKVGLNVKQITPDNPDDSAGQEDVILVQANADSLAGLADEWGYKTKQNKPRKSKTLERLLNPGKPKILLTNPDTLYLLYSLKYGGRQGAAALGHLNSYQTIVFDEFHLYQGVELVHALYLIHVARKLGSFKRVVLLSATPHEEVRHWIDKLLKPYEITMETQTPYPPVGNRTVAHQVTLTTSPTLPQNVIRQALDKVLELKPELQQLRQKNPNQDYVPIVIILNSVIKAMGLEDELRRNGFSADEILPIRGLTHRAVRQLDKKPLVVVGTSAIEVGIDFKTDYLIFEAGDAASFMQRFGRLGRHQSGQAFLLGSYWECQALASQGDQMTRPQLEENVNQIYKQANARAWFVETDLGRFAALSLSRNLSQAIVTEYDRGPEAETTKQRIETFLTQVEQDYAEQMGLNFKSIERWFKRWQKGKGMKWIGDYLALDSFRVSLPSVEVYDVVEVGQRGNDERLGHYTVDIKALLSRANDVRKKDEKIIIKGYGEWRPVFADLGLDMDETKAGVLLSTTEYNQLMLLPNQEVSTLSDIMTDESHIFVFVPYDKVKNHLDWRLATFKSKDGNYVFSFDGNALLLKEIYVRTTQNSSQELITPESSYKTDPLYTMGNDDFEAPSDLSVKADYYLYDETDD